MKHLILVLVLNLIVNFSNCQNFIIDPIGEDYYIQGTEKIKIGDYEAGDSLLTLALCSYKNEDVYYNRAVSRLYLKDTIGFCDDMSTSAIKYFDRKSEELFNKYCCKSVDTIFFNKKREESNKEDYKYYEIIKIPKYDSLAVGTFHDKDSKKLKGSLDFGCNNNLMGLNQGYTDVIAAYFIQDDKKIYTKPTQPVSIHNTVAYKDLKKRAKIYFGVKYASLKSENNLSSIQLYFQVYFNNEGDVLKVDYKGIYPEIGIIENNDELERELLEVANRYPKVTPAKFFQEKVYCVAFDSVEF